MTYKMICIFNDTKTLFDWALNLSWDSDTDVLKETIQENIPLKINRRFFFTINRLNNNTKVLFIPFKKDGYIFDLANYKVL